jgi:hypothetical protein
MHLELSDQGFKNLVEVQVFLKEETGRTFNSEEVVEYLLQNAINYAKSKRYQEENGEVHEPKTQGQDANGSPQGSYFGNSSE